MLADEGGKIKTIFCTFSAALLLFLCFCDSHDNQNADVKTSQKNNEVFNPQ